MIFRAISGPWLVIALLALVTGCSPLGPVQLPAEYTPPPAQNDFWKAVDAGAPASWHALLNDGPSALDWRLRAIDSATESIDLQTFLWKFDTAGAMVLDHLVSAADRGVSVRMLIDDTFLVHEDSMLLALAEHRNIEYRVFNPFKRRSGGLVTRQLLNLAEFSRLDHRMHNKAMVVDNQVAIVGGRNLADEYFGLGAATNFRDMELIVGGDLVREISKAFDLYWNDPWSYPIGLLSHDQASAEQLERARSVTDESIHLHEEVTASERLASWLELVSSADPGMTVLYYDEPPRDNPAASGQQPREVAKELATLFDNADSEIVIVSAYLIPTPHLEDTVDRALARGVRIRILTNSLSSNNHLTAHSAYRNHVNTLLTQGAELHEVRTDAEDRSQHMLMPVDRKRLALHAKALIIDDDKVFVGSANLDPRSLRINTEMGLLVISEEFNRSVRQAVEGDFFDTNAWRLVLQGDGSIVWVSGEESRAKQPATSAMQRLEDWFFSHMPIENKM